MLQRMALRLVLIFLISPALNFSYSQNEDSAATDSTTKTKSSTETKKDLTVPSGTKFSVSFNSEIATNKNVSGSTFSAVLAEDFIIEGDTIALKNSQVIGKILESKSGQGIGDAKLSIQITEIAINNKLTPIVTDQIDVKGGRKRDAEAVIAAGSVKEVIIKQSLVVKPK